MVHILLKSYNYVALLIRFDIPVKIWCLLFYGGLVLASIGVSSLRNEIRKEQKAIHEIRTQWIVWISGLTGLIGTITGLIALIITK